MAVESLADSAAAFSKLAVAVAVQYHLLLLQVLLLLHYLKIDKPAGLIIRLLFGFVSDSDSVSRKKVKVLRRQCCLQPPVNSC